MKTALFPMSILAQFLLSPPALGDCIDYGDYIHWLGSNPAIGAGTYEEDIVVVGTTAYVVPGGHLLQIADVSNPASPTLLSNFVLSGGGSGTFHTTGVTVVGTTAYVTAAYAGLFIINVSNPASPAIVGFVDTPGVAEDVAVAGTRAYVADYSSGLQIINISNPASPAIIGHVDTPGNAFGVALNGTIAYVADEFVGLQVIDISNPASPTIRGTVPNPGTVQAPGNAQDVEAVGSTVYVADGKSGLVVIDASNPASPTMVSNMDTPGYAWDLRVQGTRVFVADDTGGFTVIDVSNPASPVIVGRHANGYTRAIAVSGTTGFMVGHSSDFVPGTGLDTIDLSTFASVPVVGSLGVTPGFSSFDAIATSGSLVCASHGTVYVSVFDLSDPTSPVHLSYFRVGPNPAENGIVRGVALSGSMAYVTYRFSSYGGLLVIDLSTPASPQILGQLDLPDAWEVAASGTMAFVNAYGPFPDGFNSQNGFWIIDASDPYHPILVGGEDPPYDFPGFWAVTDSLAYIPYPGRIDVVDISNPILPAVIGEVDVSDWGVGISGGMTVSGTYAFAPISRQNAGATQGGAAVLQITPLPEALRLLGTTYVPIGGGGRIAVSGMTVYAPASFEGVRELYVIDASNPIAPKVVGDANAQTANVVVSGNSVCTTTANGLTILPAQCPSATAVPDPLISFHPTLGVAFPNPSRNGSTVIPFTVPKRGSVTLRIVDTSGREVRTLVNATMEPGERRVEWDGRNERGELVPAGIYVYELRASSLKAAHKLVRLR